MIKFMVIGMFCNYSPIKWLTENDPDLLSSRSSSKTSYGLNIKQSILDSDNSHKATTISLTS